MIYRIDTIILKIYKYKFIINKYEKFSLLDYIIMNIGIANSL